MPHKIPIRDWAIVLWICFWPLISCTAVASIIALSAYWLMRLSHGEASRFPIEVVWAFVVVGFLIGAWPTGKNLMTLRRNLGEQKAALEQATAAGESDAGAYPDRRNPPEDDSSTS